MAQHDAPSDRQKEKNCNRLSIHGQVVTLHVQVKNDSKLPRYSPWLCMLCHDSVTKSL